MSTASSHPTPNCSAPAPLASGPVKPPPATRVGWSSALAWVSFAVLLFLAVTGLAITFGPFHAVTQWTVLLHTAVGALTLLPQRLHVSRGLACADFDQDGDMDFAIADLGEGVRLFRNDMASGNWLKIRLRSRNPEGIANGRGYGSTAVAWVHGVPLRRSVTGSSYLSQSSTVLHWGLGDASHVDRLEVHWHAGSTQTFERLEAHRLLHQAREALGPDWQPEGTTSEGDTLQKHHDDHTPLAESWADWDGEPTLDTAFARLEHRLRRIPSPSTESIP